MPKYKGKHYSYTKKGKAAHARAKTRGRQSYKRRKK